MEVQSRAEPSWRSSQDQQDCSATESYHATNYFDRSPPYHEQRDTLDSNVDEKEAECAEVVL